MEMRNGPFKTTLGELFLCGLLGGLLAFIFLL
jgi:hypothetical protein